MRWPGLDGLRGVSILLVVAAHAGVPGLRWGGQAGVTAFFVLSGFLITNLLKNGQPLRTFYVRRAARLFPALLVLISFTVAVAGIRWGQTLPVLLYVGNWWRVAGGDLPFLGHTWSLCVEEQFYLLWPAVLPFFVRGSRRIVAAIVAVAAWRVGALLLGWDLEVQLGTASNALGLMAGAWVALNGARGPAWALWAGIAGLFAISALPAAMSREVMLLLVPPLAAGTAVVAVLGRDAGAPPLLRWIGRVSYGWYLWHFPLIRLWGGSMVSDLVLSALALAVAAASYAVMERPIMDAAAALTRPAIPGVGLWGAQAPQGRDAAESRL